MTERGSSQTLSGAQHRALGAALFNTTWELIGKQDRSAADDDLLVHTAHASCYHWVPGRHRREPGPR
jgi:hypothetical protein